MKKSKDRVSTYLVSISSSLPGNILLVLLAELADRVTMKRDLEIARDIQSWLMPSAAP
jgi:hypothetical protein